MHTTTDARPGSGARALAQRHPVALFLLLAVGSTYVFSMIPILMAFDVLPGRARPTSWALAWRERPPAFSTSSCWRRHCW